MCSSDLPLLPLLFDDPLIPTGLFRGWPWTRMGTAQRRQRIARNGPDNRIVTAVDNQDGASRPPVTKLGRQRHLTITSDLRLNSLHAVIIHTSRFILCGAAVIMRTVTVKDPSPRAYVRSVTAD